MSVITASWRLLASAESLRRSSQTISILGDKAFVFGGELRPREPRDNNLYTVSLQRIHDAVSPSSDCIKQIDSTPNFTPPRVGAASTSLRDKLYLFSGRGNASMTPIEEHGSFWVLDSSTSTWVLMSPSNSNSPYPAARSFHSLANDSEDVIYLHAGCPKNGRLSDLWSFHISSRTWNLLKSAPDPPRGGTSIAFSEHKLFRMNGFDGKTEQGGQLDIYDPKTDLWTTLNFKADGIAGPEPRSVSALLPITFGGAPQLLTLFGERDPSALGHQGAGKMLSDIWAFDLHTNDWSRVEPSPVQAHSGQASIASTPDARGWFAADVLNKNTIVVQGGLGESNERFEDLWSLEF